MIFQHSIMIIIITYFMKVCLFDTPKYEELFHFIDIFEDNESFSKKWHHSTLSTNNNDLEYKGEFIIGPEKNASNNNALIMNNPSSFNKFGIFRMLDKPFYFNDVFILQYELSFKNDHQCGGAYIKLISIDSGLSNDMTDLNSSTPYTIMFGPDVCELHYKFHFIFRHKNPITGVIEEKHMKQPDPSSYKHIFSDGKVHLLRLSIYSWGQRYVIELDNYILSQGTLINDFVPPVNPNEYIDDPNDVKPTDWDDREYIVDVNDVKPDDWDESEPQFIEDPNAVMPDSWLENEPLTIDDPNAVKPDEWNDNIDGEWMPPKIPNPICENKNCGPWSRPLIKNPKYKGIFTPRKIKNPSYQGEFKPRKIKNEHYFYDENPFNMTPIGAVAIEVVASPNVITFDNIIITNNAEALILFNSNNWKLKNPLNLKSLMKDYKIMLITGGVIIISIMLVISVIVLYTKLFKKKSIKIISTDDKDDTQLSEEIKKNDDDNDDEELLSTDSHSGSDKDTSTRHRSVRQNKSHSLKANE